MPNATTENAAAGATEVSYGTTSMNAISQSACSSPMPTVSEIYPDDSVSNRNLNLRRRLFGGDADDEVNDPSTISLHPSDDDQLYTVVGGRAFSSQSEIYALPADGEEHSRLDMQHFAICLYNDSLFPFKDLVRGKLYASTQPAVHVIDIGTGSGRWAVDMAVNYPSVQVLGVDLVPPALIPMERVPENCRFEIDDANLSLEHYSDTFTIVHARMVDSGLNDTESFMYEVARTLKPGGVLLLGTGDLQLWDANLEPFPWVEPGEPGFSWAQYILGHAYRAFWYRGCVSAGEIPWWKDWLEANPNYSEVHEENICVPIGPWKQGLNDREKFAANLMREDIARAFVAMRRLLLADGHREEDIDFWIEGGVKELRDLSKPAYFRCRFYGAIRSDAPWQPRGIREFPEDITTRSIVKGADVNKPWKSREKTNA